MTTATVRMKSRQFAVRVIRMYQFLTEKQHEYVLSKQVLRSGTSIGANIAEAECAFSRKDFAAKMQIAFKECAETRYWLDLLYETDYLTEKMFDSMMRDCDALFKMLSSITKTIREKDNKKLE